MWSDGIYKVRGLRNDGKMESRNNGMIEYWNTGVLRRIITAQPAMPYAENTTT